MVFLNNHQGGIMAFGFSKKKKTSGPDLPPPPSPPEKQGMPGDFAPIKPKGKVREPLEDISVKPAPIGPPPPMQRSKGLTPPPILPKMPQVQSKPLSTPLQKRELKKIYDKTIKETVPERKEIIRRTPTKPIFVSTEDYKKIMDDSNTIKARLLEADEFLNRLSTIEKQEEILFGKWRSRLEDVEKKLNYVDKIVSKAK